MQTPTWRQAMKTAFTDLDELLAFLELDKNRLNLPIGNSDPFSLRVPRGFVALMKPGDPNDPLLLQVLPSGREAIAQPGFNNNPVGDLESQSVPGILHKYHGRALILASGACAVHCRYCFRRHYPYHGGTASPRQWQDILGYLKADPSIREVILSGGDPLMLQDERLAEWFANLAGIPHLQRLRLHTRLPVVLPERITPHLIELLSGLALPTVVVLHVNHPNELSPALTSATRKMHRNNITLLNQAVLLKDVNDSRETLTTLSEKLFAAGILPYYLHLLDRVQGSAHFEVPEPEARKLYRALLAKLPGYLVPKLVKEITGQTSKTPLGIS